MCFQVFIRPLGTLPTCSEKAAKGCAIHPETLDALVAEGCVFQLNKSEVKPYPSVPAVINTTHKCCRFKVNVYTTMPTRVMTYTTKVVSL